MSDYSEIISKANEELVNQGQLDRIGAYFCSDYCVELTGKTLKGGHRGIEKVLQQLQHSFADLQVELEIFLAADDRICWQRTFNAVHQAAYKGFPASGKSLCWRDMVCSEFREGKIAREWVLSDLAEQLLLARKH
jgi:steroid delta-isomerase-like uncharacterized protein